MTCKDSRLGAYSRVPPKLPQEKKLHVIELKTQYTETRTESIVGGNGATTIGSTGLFASELSAHLTQAAAYTTALRRAGLSMGAPFLLYVTALDVSVYRLPSDDDVYGEALTLAMALQDPRVLDNTMSPRTGEGARMFDRIQSSL